MADNGMLESATAAAIEQVPGVEKRGNRVRNWLMKEQANSVLNAPNPKTLTGLRDRAILALLLGCGLRRAELLRINFEDLQQREGRWVLPDMAGKGNRVRTVTVPAGVKTRIDVWLKASGIDGRPPLPPCQQGGRACRPRRFGTRKRSGGLSSGMPRPLTLESSHRTTFGRTCAKLCRKGGGDLEQIQLLLGHASIQTTERYLGTEQALAHAVNDAIGLDMG